MAEASRIADSIGFTLDRFIKNNQGQFQYASGELSQLLRDIALGDDMGGCRLAVDRPRDGLFRGLIVEVLNLLVVLGVPMDEHADANEQIVGFAHGDNACRDTVGDSLADSMLSRAEHLHGLCRILDRHFVIEDGRGLAHQVWGYESEQSGETLLVVGKCTGKRRFGRAAARLPFPAA